MSGLSTRRRGRVGGGRTNSTESARGLSARTAASSRPATARSAAGPIQAPPVFGRCRDGTYTSSKGLVTPLDKFSPLSARTKMGIMASLHAEKGIMHPLWPRVSSTPYYPRHQVLHGNGREMHSCSVSFEAPDFFHIPQVMDHKYHPSKGTFTDVKVRHGALAVGSTAESPDLPPYLTVPGIQDFWRGYNRRKGDPHHRLMFFRHQTMFEPRLARESSESSIKASIFGDAHAEGLEQEGQAQRHH